MDCTHCNVRPAVIGGIPTSFGLADLCNHCLRAVERKRSKRTDRDKRSRKSHKAKPPRHDRGQYYFPFMYETEGQQQFAFMYETGTDGPDETARPN